MGAYAIISSVRGYIRFTFTVHDNHSKDEGMNRRSLYLRKDQVGQNYCIPPVRQPQTQSLPNMLMVGKKWQTK